MAILERARYFMARFSCFVMESGDFLCWFMSMGFWRCLRLYGGGLCPPVPLGFLLAWRGTTLRLGIQ